MKRVEWYIIKDGVRIGFFPYRDMAVSALAFTNGIIKSSEEWKSE